ncbi:hypothetical protein FDECE_11710 [Fusarium decemcellulare]|nr:hypothetical protein FDECE_11710 [Fusarium decemcellulare]
MKSFNVPLLLSLLGSSLAYPGSVSSLVQRASNDSIDSLTTIVETMAIWRTKALYCRMMDTKNWDGFGDVFTDDVVIDTTDSLGSVYHGREEFVKFVSKTLGKVTTTHHVHTPEIDITGPDTAKGIWAMEDWLSLGPLNEKGTGHYHETYRKEDGTWKIATSTLTRLHLSGDLSIAI